MNFTKLFNSLKLNHKVLKVYSPKYSTHPFRFIEIQDRWRKHDEVSRNWELIYKAPMTNAIKWATTYVTAITGLTTCAGIYYAITAQYMRDYNEAIYLGEDIVLADNLTECFIYLAAFLVFHLAAQKILSTYVLRMYKDGDKYIAIYKGQLFSSQYKYEFHLNDFKRVKSYVPLLLPWSDSKYSLGNKRGIILEDYFKSQEYLNYLLNKNENKMFEN